MKVYIAAPYGARDRIRATFKVAVEDAGHEVVSSWLDEDMELTDGTQGAAFDVSDDDVAKHALTDLDEILGCDVVVLLTADIVQTEGGGGRHVETGYAIACSKPVLVVGVPENVFHRMGGRVLITPNTHTAVQMLDALAMGRVL